MRCSGDLQGTFPRLFALRRPRWGLKDVGRKLTDGDHYRIKAAAFHAQAQAVDNREIKRQFENLSRAYLRLAQLADHNATVELVYEPPPPTLRDSQN